MYLCKKFSGICSVGLTKNMHRKFFCFRAKNLRFQNFLAFCRTIFRAENILESIKPRTPICILFSCFPLGMVMQLKRAVGEQFILSREHQLMEKARQKLSKLENLILLGNGLNGDSCSYLPVLSFVIRAPSFGGFLLHHNFVCALLNDLFGIQARGGRDVQKACSIDGMCKQIQ